MVRACWAIGMPAACLPAAGCQPPSWNSVPVARLALLTEPTGLYVPIAINGRPVKLLLDTGSTQSLLTSESARRLGLRIEHLLDDTDVLMGFAIEGLGGRRHIDRAWTHKVELGSLLLLGVAFPVVWSANTSWNPTEDGILGMDILSGYDMDLDVGHGRLALYEPGSLCLPPPALNATTTTFSHILAVASPQMAVRIDGKTLNAIIDTGTQTSSIMAHATADFPWSGKPEGKEFDVYGVGTSRGRAYLRRFGSVSVGGVVFPHWPLAVITTPDMHSLEVVVGTDMLSRIRAWFSPSKNRLSVAASGHASF